MSTLPSPTQVAGVQYTIYDTYFNQLEKQGTIPAIDAAKFLKKSGLSDAILSRIWDLSDPNSKGYLTKAGFFSALKLVSLAQLGHEVSFANILMEVPPPNMGTTPSRGSQPTINSVSPTIIDWSMKPNEKAKYDQLFDSLQPLNGVIPGNKVKGLLIDSKLPVATLGKIWDLADMDKDGSLDRHEFLVAMHLVYKALEKYSIPNTLPPELLPPNKRKNSTTFQPAGVQPAVQPAVNGGLNWVVNAEEKIKFDQLFQMTDLDKDGFVSGHEIKDIFLQSGVPQTVLANIWGLCDIKQSGKLNCDQFALAMWLISQKLKGIDPPTTLSPDMIPPSMRPVLNEPVVTPYSNPELNLISQDIDELVKEKQLLEGEILQKESEIKIKVSEASSLQGELETLVATLKQLENQKGEAHKRLNDLKNQTDDTEKEINDMQKVLDIKQNQVDKLRKDAEEQATLVRSQEDELLSRRKELEALLQEETKLENENIEQSRKLSSLCNFLQESQLNISQIRSIIVTIQEQQRQLKEAIEVVDTAIVNNETSTVPNRFLDLEPQFRDPSYKRLVNNKIDDNSNNANEMPNGTTQDNEFSQNVFKNDPFASNTKFSTAFSKSTSKLEFDQSDPFASFDNTASGKCDPFDPFGSTGIQPAKTEDDFNSDPFGCEPFEVSAPALPPKNKQPPPRPAPPRPAPPPSLATTPNPVQPTDAFADFSNFNSKLERIVADTTTKNHSTNLNISSNNNNNNNNLKNNQNDVTNKFDFTEDPFKDYRYEDTFHFADDPFAAVDNNIDDDNNKKSDNLFNDKLKIIHSSMSSTNFHNNFDKKDDENNDKIATNFLS
ncbi:epidermal growth factor receptor pathway substrate 15 isoform X2 [Rhodnius prolixus]|uniref:epidermal growth factor receptor pathway substrate 15 isoform X2 n=1 Tax=Rhodnius prolixus TaxID=13249 RepID=UPI003D18B698